jgi:hypothetical protein
MLRNAVKSKSSHSHCVVLSWLWKAADGDIAVSNCLNLKYSAPQGHTIKRGINGLKEREDLGRLADR